MKYSELIGKTVEEVGYTAYGIEVDQLILGKKPDYLVRLGFVLNSLDVADSTNYALATLITFISTGEYGREVIAEIPHEVEVDEPNLKMLSGCKVSISLLPPRLDYDVDWENYTQKLIKILHLWLTDSNIHRLVYPISGYFEYLVLEQLGYIPERITDDEYTLKRFVDEFDAERMDQVKDRLKDYVIDFFGGEDQFKSFISTVGIGSLKRAELACQSVIDRVNQEQAEKDAQPIAGDENPV